MTSLRGPNTSDMANANELQIDPKRAIPRDEQEKTSKIFVGGVSQETTDQEFKDYFAQFGRVVDATLMMDKDTGRPRGFGFVTFENEDGVEACLKTSLEIHGKPIEVKKAQPRGNLREEEEAARRGGKFRKADDQTANSQGMNSQMGGSGGMTPQVMAQYFQRMQNYFAMMQQQMAMQRGMPMNPQMMQQMMQMQQMQQMQNQMMGGRGGGGQSPQAMMNNMTPQMMQQMQQMQNQMMASGAGGGSGAGGAPAAGNQAGMGGGQGQGNGGGFNDMGNQQQLMYDDQGRHGGREQYGNQGAYGMGGGQGQGGGPTSWEGMYDDVPQPNMPPQGPSRGGGFNRNRGGASPQVPHDPNRAPPANAPTGPKNAGKPGANYRGGGRGGNRGFHPYSRG